MTTTLTSAPEETVTAVTHVGALDLADADRPCGRP